MAAYARALVAEHNGDLTHAAAEFSLAQQFWTAADPDFAPLIDVRNHLAVRK